MNSQEYRPSPLAAVGRTSSAGRWTLVFTRDLRHPVETVWAAITDPEQLREWAPYTKSRDLRSAREATLTMQGDDLAPGGELPRHRPLGDGPFGPVVGTKAREYGWDRLNVENAQSLGIDPAQV